MSTARILRSLGLGAALLLVMSAASQADLIATPYVIATPLPQAAHGSVWFVPEVPNPSCGTACLSVPMDSVPTTPADVTFSTSIINFSSFGTTNNTGDGLRDFKIGSFLNSLGAVPLANQTYSPFASTLTGNVPTPDTVLIGLCGITCIPGPGGWTQLYGTFIEITGDLLLKTGDHVKIAHDDGVTFTLDGALVPGFTAPLVADHPEGFTYLGPPGLVGFDLTYAEGVTPPAFLQLSVPEPGTVALFGTSLLGLGWLARRRRAW
jgi:hypothetical protein